MAKPRTIESLQIKKAEIEWAVAAYGRKYHQAQTDLAHITAALALFEASGDKQEGRYRLCQFRPHLGPASYCACAWASLHASEGPLSTRELAARAIKASDMDTLDEVLAKTVACKVVYVMRAQEKRRAIGRAGIKDGACIWAVSER